MHRGQPFLSVIIPTRNRAHLLPHAIRSVLEQPSDDIEVVVVANNCRDATAEVVAAVADTRVRFVSVDRTLSMPENWDFSWTHARGKYATFLADDDALSSSALERVLQILRREAPPLLSWHDASYYYPMPAWPDPSLANVVILPWCGESELEVVPADQFRSECAEFRFRWNSPLPKLLNCAVDVELFSDWRKRLGTLFLPIAPDYSFAWISTHILDEIWVLNRPLSVRGISLNSIGSNAGLTEAATEFYREFGDLDFFAKSVVSIPITINHIAATFARASERLHAAGRSTTPVALPDLLLAVARQFKEVERLLPEWEGYLPQLALASQQVSPALFSDVMDVLGLPTPSAALMEPVVQTRLRTARMAVESPSTYSRSLCRHRGDVELARMALGLEPGVLVSSDWDSLSLIGEELKIANPFDVSRLVDRYYDVLTRGRLTATAQANQPRESA